jgi:hypothetical protein
MRSSLRFVFAFVLSAFASANAGALDATLQAKLDAELKEVKALAADATIVAAVKTHNTGGNSAAVSMTQEQWKMLTVLDTFVRARSKNPAGETLRAKKSAAVAEAFISGADGTKVAFLAKPSSWSHAGKPKHDVPMSGKSWQGPVEVDESSGLQQIQVGVPIMDDGKVIGSLVVGLSVAKLAE